jgi:Rieske Fe-S protein
VKVTRRAVIRVLGSGTVFTLGCGLPDAGSDGGVDDAGTVVTELRVPLSMLPVGGFVAVGSTGCSGTSSGAIVGRDASGVYAFSSVCTHQRGTVGLPNASGLATCCLHGAQFDRTGEVVRGITPGQRPLPHFQVRIEGEDVVVEVGTPVSDRSTRVPV